MLVDPVEATIAEANARATELFDCSYQELPASDPCELLTDDPGREHDFLALAVEERSGWTDELRWRTYGGSELSLELSERLTPPLPVAIETAYITGYYEYPRKTTAQELAEAMDIAAPTFHQHLREAENEVLDPLLPDAPERAGDRRPTADAGGSGGNATSDGDPQTLG